MGAPLGATASDSRQLYSPIRTVAPPNDPPWYCRTGECRLRSIPGAGSASVHFDIVGEEIDRYRCIELVSIGTFDTGE